ncbi:MAG: peptide chain release factor N(5)-glutamine methyltransferase [Alphaproteobacteria bacterium]|nr:peptide chain release factor N(5)-glutamine methyltransferase [Alphaproteobacteria bacterium]
MSAAPRQGRARLTALAERLAAAGIDEPRRELRLLQIEAGGTASLADWPDSPHPCLEVLTARRAAREPLSRIVGRREFWSRDFLLTPEVFDPRPDSEAVVEAALTAMPSCRTVLDLGTGSGCLLAALLAERPEARGLGIDRSPGACRAARRNLADLPAVVAAGDWARAVAGRFDLVVSNPPYIPSADIAALMPEVRDHDPRLALDGGADGLDAYRAILADLPRLLSPAGVAVLELGFGQADAVAALAGAQGFRVRDIRADLGGIPRAMVLGL